MYNIHPIYYNFYYKFIIYNFLINSKQLSWILIPLSLIIIYNEKYINYFNYLFLYIACIGIIDNIFQYKYHKSLFVYYGVLIFHALLLYPLINIKKYMKPNLINYIFSILAIFFIILLPYWPYILSKQIFILTLVIVNVLSTILYSIYY